MIPRYLFLGFWVVFYLWFAHFLLTYREVSEPYRLYFIDKTVDRYLKNGTRDIVYRQSIKSTSPSLYYDDGWRYDRERKHYVSTDDYSRLVLRPQTAYDGPTCLKLTVRYENVKFGDVTTSLRIAASVNDVEAYEASMGDGAVYLDFPAHEFKAKSELTIELYSPERLYLDEFSLVDMDCRNARETLEGF